MKRIKSRKFIADLHIHTCLSPCGNENMTPPNILKQAEKCGIDIIGICDHNSAENCVAMVEAAQEYNTIVFPGMEVTSKEEVHILGLFNSLSAVDTMQDTISACLDGENDEDIFGLQLVVNHKGEVIQINHQLLIGATTLSVHKIVQKIHELHGIAIAAHIDRESFSIISQLGFIPSEIQFDGLEISSRLMGIQKKELAIRYPDYQNYPFLCSSDAHFIEEIGKGKTEIIMFGSTFEEFLHALQGKDRRKILVNEGI